jgi:acyl-CoA reductase-like NAD-dependent aldehyde dehydrogenase
VQESIYEKFIEAYTAKIAAKKNVIGDPEKKGTELGPVVDQHQYDRIMNIIDTAKREGQGSLLLGGNKIGSKARSLVSVNDYWESNLTDQ